MPAANVTLTGETAQMKTNYTFVTEPEGLESHITAPNETQRGQWSGNQPLSLTVDYSFDDKVYNHVYKQEKTLKNLKISTFFSV